MILAIGTVDVPANEFVKEWLMAVPLNLKVRHL